MSKINPDKPKRMNFSKLPPIHPSAPPMYQQDAEPANGAHEATKDFYDDEIKKKRHNCTDIICLILFLIFILVQVALSILIYTTGGDPKNLLLPHDSKGNLCEGSTPNLFYFNLIDCLNINVLFNGCTTPTVCVSDCPSDNLYYMISSHRSRLLQKYCKQSDLSFYFNNQIPSSVDQSTYYNLISGGICPIYTLQSSPIFNRCLPSFLSTAIETAENIYATDSTSNQTFQISDLNKPLTTDLIKNSAKSLLKLINLKGIAQFILEDFISSYVLIIILIVIAAIVSFIYIIIIRWVLVVTLVGLLGFGIYFCINKYLTLRDAPQQNQPIQVTASIDYYLSLSITWLIVGIIAIILLVIILLLILVLAKRVRIAIKIIGEASRAVTSVFLTLIFPLIPLLLQIGCLAYFVVNAVILACSGKAIFKVSNSTSNSTIKIGDTCDPSINVQGAECIFNKVGFDPNSAYNTIIGGLNTYQWIPQLYNLFMLFWVQAFLVGFNQMVLAGSFGIWYWSKSKEHFILLKSIKDTLFYHLGSIAFGALLIAICKLIRTLIQIIERRVKAAANRTQQTACILNGIITFISCCCKCCFLCLEKFLKFINRNAYIMVAIYGKNFCSSAKDALALLAANPLRAIVLDRITDFILFLGRLLITVGVGVLGFNFFAGNFYVDPSYRKYFQPELHYYWVPLIVVILGSYFVSKTFFTVFEMAVDTIFLCAMKDLDVHDGSPQKPYFMSKRLLKILKKKFYIEEDSHVLDKKNSSAIKT